MAEFYLQNDRPDRAVLIYESILSTRLAKEWREPARLRLQTKKMLADTHVELDHLDEAGVLYEEVLAAAQLDRNLSKDAGTMGPIYQGMGDVLFKKSELNSAIEAYQNAAKYCAQSAGRRSIQYLTLINNIASCHFAKQTPESMTKANETAQKGLDLAGRLRSNSEVTPLVDNLRTIIEHTK
jgi:tetratricopeptide (TPR) repeat protein